MKAIKMKRSETHDNRDNGICYSIVNFLNISKGRAKRLLKSKGLYDAYVHDQLVAGADKICHGTGLTTTFYYKPKHRTLCIVTRTGKSSRDQYEV